MLAGLAVAIPVTVADWRLNPGGLFHGPGGTQWNVVGQTAWSWFWPVALLGFAMAGVVHHAIASRNKPDLQPANRGPRRK